MSFYKENILNKNSNDNTSANILKISKIILLLITIYILLYSNH